MVGAVNVEDGYERRVKRKQGLLVRLDPYKRQPFGLG